MSRAARIAALCVSTMGPCDRTFFNAWSTYAATSRVYSGGRSDRTVYSSPPIITLTACFLVLTQAPPALPALVPPPVPPPFPPVWRACSSRKVSRDNRSCTRVRAPSTRWRNVLFSCSSSATRPPGPGPSSPEAAFFQLRFGFQGTRAPAGELIRHVAEHRLQLIQHAPVNSLSVVRQARPPAPAALLPAARPLRALAASGRGPGRCSATPRCGIPPAPRRRDTRRTLRVARAAVPPREPARPTRPRHSHPPAGAARCPVPRAAVSAAGDSAPRRAASHPIAPRTRTTPPPRPGRRLRAGRPSPTPPPVAPPPNRPPHPLPVARRMR